MSQEKKVSNNTRIAKNTLFLYMRMIFQLLVGLFSSRVILNALGITDFGIYNVVGGVVSMFSFLNGSMGAATTRFLTFELGKENSFIRLRRVFCTALLIHLVVCFLFFILAETIGLWYVCNKLVLPSERLTAALWCYQFSVITGIIGILSVPYNAAIVSHEKMGAFAYISIYEVLMQLIVALCIMYIPSDKLILYGFLLMVVQTSVRFVYGSYCARHFSETKGPVLWDKQLCRDMVKFAFWIINGSIALVGYTAGINLLLNLFFGPAVNAARGVSVIVQSKVMGFCNNFQMAVNPQITKSYAVGDKQYMYNLICNSSKYSMFLIYFLSFPIILNADYILHLWLGIVPNYAVVFVQLTLFVGIIDALRMPMNTAIHSTGNIKIFQIFEGTTLLMILPIAYISLKLGGSPIVVFIVQLMMFCVVQAERIIIVCPRIGMPIPFYLKKVVYEGVKVMLLASVIPLFFNILHLFTNGFFNCLMVVLVSVCSTAIVVYWVDLNKEQRIKLKQTVLKKYIYKMDRKLVYVGFAFLHHKGTHAGYHQILNYLNYDYVIDCQKYFENAQHPWDKLSLIRKFKRKVFLRLFGIHVIPWYIFQILWLGITHNNLVFHFIYGENLFFPWMKKIIRKGNVIVCTFHQPYDFFLNDGNRKQMVLKSDRIILVGETEIEKFKSLTRKDNVVYIPHGICTDFYSIDENIKKEHCVLTVGSWLRDYEFANKVYQELIKKDSTFQIHIVSNPKNKELITLSDRITFMSGITDNQLREEYLKSSILFLPLTRYTANNSLLEASATGCNIIIASDYPDNSYIPEKYLSIVKMNVDAVVNTIEERLSSDFNESLSLYIEEEYSWPVIADKTEKYLRKL